MDADDWKGFVEVVLSEGIETRGEGRLGGGGIGVGRVGAGAT